MSSQGRCLVGAHSGAAELCADLWDQRQVWPQPCSPRGRLPPAEGPLAAQLAHCAARGSPRLPSLPPPAVGVLLDLRPTRAAPGTRSHSRKSEVPWLRTLCPCSCPAVPRASTVRTALSPSSTPSFSVPGGRPRREQPECWGRCGARPPGLHRGPRAVRSGPGRTPSPVESGGLAGRPRDLTEGPCGCHLRPQSGGPRSRSRPSVQTHSCGKGGAVGVSSGRSVDRGAGRRGCGAKTSVAAADALVQAAPWGGGRPGWRGQRPPAPSLRAPSRSADFGD